MYIIADSSSTRTEWALVDNETTVAQSRTQGLNPYFLTRREISHCIRLELPDEFFRRRWDKIYFYGAGCANPQKNKILEQSLVAQFRTPVEINSDLLGAARGLFVHSKGLACIMGTGSNSCTYNGEIITQNVRSGGYVLGDEGSGAHLGKAFLADCLKNLAPQELISALYTKYEINADSIMDEIYSGPSPNKILARYSHFLYEYKETDYVKDLVKQGFRSFFKRSITQYEQYKKLPVSFVGRTASNFEMILREVAEEFNVRIDKITDRSLPGLIEYHRSR